MIHKIEIKSSITEYLYSGTFDLGNENKTIQLDVGENIQIDLNVAISSTKETLNKLHFAEIQFICKTNNIKAIIYPNGNVSFRKLDSSDDELKSCYLSSIQKNKNEYIICIAFDETQPMIYKAQLLSIFKFEKDLR